MDFSERKLPLEAAESMRLCPINSVHPYVPMLAPMYIFLRRNVKFVSVKGPLDFFTPEELQKLLPSESFFIPPCVDQAIPFRDAGSRIRAILSWKPRTVTTEESLSPTPYELSDSIIQIAGPLWGSKMTVEPFFMTVLITELLKPLQSEHLIQAREQSVELYETCVLRSSCAAFLALLYGLTDLEFLEAIQTASFLRTLHHGSDPDPITKLPDCEQILQLAEELVPDSQTRSISIDQLDSRPERTAKKIVSRLARVVHQHLISEQTPSVSIYENGGFLSNG